MIQREKTSQAFRDVLHDQYKSSYSQRNCDRKKRHRKALSCSPSAATNSTHALTSTYQVKMNGTMMRDGSTNKSSSLNHSNTTTLTSAMTQQVPIHVKAVGTATEKFKGHIFEPTTTVSVDRNKNLLQEASLSDVTTSLQSSLSKHSVDFNDTQFIYPSVMEFEWKLAKEKEWLMKYL
jgi:hypothetical protein